MNLDKEVKKILLEKGMTKIDLADKIGTNTTSLNRRLNAAALEKIEEILDSLGYELVIQEKDPELEKLKKENEALKEHGKAMASMIDVRGIGNKMD